MLANKETWGSTRNNVGVERNNARTDKRECKGGQRRTWDE
jgi:hypothetical protein